MFIKFDVWPFNHAVGEGIGGWDIYSEEYWGWWS